MTPLYTIVQEFLKIEAVGTWGASNGTPFNPIRINAYVTASDNLGVNVESRDTINNNDAPFLYRVANGRWALKLCPELYQQGKSYTVGFRYWATPENVNVLRQTFIWSPVPSLPRNSDNCIVYGHLKDLAGLPVCDQILIVEKYKNLVTLNERETQSTVKTDAFGLWYIELPTSAVFRIVFGNLSKVIQVPFKTMSALSEIADYQPAPSLRDKFGYPFPTGA